MIRHTTPATPNKRPKQSKGKQVQETTPQTTKSMQQTDKTTPKRHAICLTKTARQIPIGIYTQLFFHTISSIALPSLVLKGISGADFFANSAISLRAETKKIEDFSKKNALR